MIQTVIARSALVSVLILVETPPPLSKIWLLTRGGFSKGLEIWPVLGPNFSRAYGAHLPCVYPFLPAAGAKKSHFQGISPLKTAFSRIFFGRAFGAHLYSKSPCYTAQMIKKMRAEGAPGKKWDP